MWLSTKLHQWMLLVELDGSSWYQVEDILDHRGKAGPMCECLVRWKDFDVSHDSWVRRKLLTPLALQAYVYRSWSLLGAQGLQYFAFFGNQFSYRCNFEDVRCCAYRSHCGSCGCSYFYIFFRAGPSTTHSLQRYKTLVLSISFSSCSFRCNLCINFQCRAFFTFL
jgi:hypothetical protein